MENFEDTQIILLLCNALSSNFLSIKIENIFSSSIWEYQNSTQSLYLHSELRRIGPFLNAYNYLKSGHKLPSNILLLN